MINGVECKDVFEGMKEMPDESVDLVLTDPPYYIENLKENLKGKTPRKSTKNAVFYAEWDNNFVNLQEYQDFMRRYLSECHRIMKDKSQMYMFCSYSHIDWLIPLIKELNFQFYKPLIWHKPDMVALFPNHYACSYELMLWFRKGGKKGSVKLRIGCKQSDVMIYNSTNKAYRAECGWHPTPKPYKLIARLIENASDAQDVVFDGFMGSGTTAVAAKNLNRRYIGFEKNPEYMQTIKTRLSQQNLDHTGTLNTH